MAKNNSQTINNASDVRAICPHCSVASTFVVLAQNFFNLGQQIEIHLMLKCNYARCNRLMYVQTAVPTSRSHHQPGDQFFMFPSCSTVPPHVSIPTAVAEDWKEGQVAFEVNAPKAAAVMFRRVLYGVLLDKGCRLFPLKDGLADLIKNERLPAMFDQWLPAIRDDGHDAAHPDRALQVSPANIAETMEYTAELLRYLYIEPYEFQQRQLRNAIPTGPLAAPQIQP